MVQQKKVPNSGDIPNGRQEQPNMSFQRKDITDARALSGNTGKADGKANGMPTLMLDNGEGPR